jgi:LacI family transcriptional regulator
VRTHRRKGYLAGGAVKRKRPTQADVARLAGVSQAMVSYVINRSSTVAVPEETRRRILDAADELGYVPDRAARSLKTRKAYMIASVIPDITNPFYPAFERGIQRVAEYHGYDLVIYNTDGWLKKERKCLRSALQGRVDGVVAVLFHATVRDLGALLEQGIAVVRLEATRKRADALNLPLDNLYVDNASAACSAVDRLFKHGHARIGMITGQSGPGHARLLGYRRSLTKHRIPLDRDLVRDGGFNEEGGYRAMRELLELAAPPTAVFAANDTMAVGAMVAIKETGLIIPQDVAVVGFDNIPAARMVTPSLTTVTQFQEKLGCRAAEMLFERLDGSAPESGRCEEMPYRLLVREST